jgi:hypothetical protein
MVKRQKDRQHNGQKTEGQTTQWSKDRKIDNTILLIIMHVLYTAFVFIFRRLYQASQYEPDS